MRDHVTVVPEDRCVIVDGIALFFDFNAPGSVRAVQWHEGAGQVELHGKPARVLGPEDYAAEVAPYAALWEAERARMTEEARENAKAALKERRKAAETGGFTFMGDQWGSGEKDERRLTSVVKSLEIAGGEIENWRVSEDVVIPSASLDLLETALAAMAAHHGACYAVETEKKEQLARLGAPEEISGWLRNELNTGWPE